MRITEKRSTVAAGMAALALVVLSGCMQGKEARIRGALMQAGLGENSASCMARPLARDLGNDQLKAIDRVVRNMRGTKNDLTIADALRLIERDVDPATVAIVSRAGLSCFIGNGGFG